jgi:hypothetical protein
MLPLDQVPRPLPSKSWEEIVKQLSVHGMPILVR